MVSINDIIKAGDRMAAMPGTIVRLTTAIAQGNTDPEEITSLIKNDEVLTGAVLRRANSVSFGSQGRTHDLRASIVRLGTKNLMHLIMEQKASGIFGDSGAAHQCTQRKRGDHRTNHGGRLSVMRAGGRALFENLASRLADAALGSRPSPNWEVF